MIVETLANQFFAVKPSHVEHCYDAIEVKRVKDGWTPKANARPILLRKEGCKLAK